MSKNIFINVNVAVVCLLSGNYHYCWFVIFGCAYCHYCMFVMFVRYYCLFVMSVCVICLLSLFASYACVTFYMLCTSLIAIATRNTYYNNIVFEFEWCRIGSLALFLAS